jgi:protein involved in polysaccharide export with SLBB domain
MEVGEGGAFRQLSRQPWLGFLLGLLAGCAAPGPPIDRALLADTGMTARRSAAAEAYLVHCPDVLDVLIDARPELSGFREIGPDGQIDLGRIGRVRVEGQTVTEVKRRLADITGVPSAWIHIRVAEYNSQQIFLIGQVVGQQRAVPYQGPEPVLDLLHRVGGIAPGAAPDDVYVIRSRIAEGQPHQVFRVDLRAILLRMDSRTNLPLQPLDQVYVGETRQFSLVRCIPPWLRPLVESICGMRRPPDLPNDETEKEGGMGKATNT